jgi:molybdopterin synthase sulfur carrier subunit
MMPRIKVKLFANFREFAGAKELVVEGSTPIEVIESLCLKFPGFDELIIKNGELRPYINIFLNGNDIIKSGGLNAFLKNNDELAIFPPVSGGYD